MTNEEKFIKIMSDYTQQDEQFIKLIYEIQNKKDWAYFRSEMGDYDHPEERTDADSVFEKEISKLAKSIYGEIQDWRLNMFLDSLKGYADQISRSGFYMKHFHHMTEEYKEEK